jgi:hypothetical protein
MDEASRRRRGLRGTQRRVSSRRLIRLKGCLTIDGAPTRAKKPAKSSGSPIFPHRDAFIECGEATECGEAGRFASKIWNHGVRGIESGPPVTSNQFRAISKRREANTHDNCQLPAAPRCRARLPIDAILPPGDPRAPERCALDARPRDTGRRGKYAPSDCASKWPWRNLNLPLAAGPRVRHIRADGAVAEWLKAAVC